MRTGVIFDIQRYCIHNGPGIRTTVFFKGCPLECAWCHNPESRSIRPELLYRANLCQGCLDCVPACPQAAIGAVDGRPVTDRSRCTVSGECVRACPSGAREIAGRRVSAAELMAEIERDIPFFDESGGGVTFSGGEPLYQPDFLRDALAGCRARDLHTALDTSGFARWEVIDAIRHDVDLFLYDLKGMDDGRHRRNTGRSNRIVLENLAKLSRMGHRLILRVPLVLGLNDGPAEIEALGKFARSLPQVERMDLLPYHRAGIDKYERLGKPAPAADLQPYPDGQVEAMAACLASYGLKVQIGG